MKFAYDLDGVLAQGPPKSLFGAKWGKLKGPERAARKQALLEWYKIAAPIYMPDDSFHVITARRDDPDVRATTEWWLQAVHAERVLGVHMLNVGRTLVNVVAFKAGVLQRIDVTAYLEDNLSVLRGLRKAGVPQALYYFDGKEQHRFD